MRLKVKINKQYTPEVTAKQAEMFANRLKKVMKSLKPKMAQQKVEAFRLYDRDIPEIRAVADWYAGHLVIGEYVREQTEDESWVRAMAEAAGTALGLAPENVHIRRRNTRPKEGERYQKLAESGELVPVREGSLQFLINFHDYLDVGLFLDHRETRKQIRNEVKGKSFLNLFSYTGSFSCYAAEGGARSVTTVDMSARYLDWAKQNMELNKLSGVCEQEWFCAETRSFLDKAAAQGRRWDIVFLDPPSFSTREGMEDFDIFIDHRGLVERCLKVMAPRGTLYFSTNHQRFDPDLEDLQLGEATEITGKHLPIDFQGKEPHRLWKIVRN